MAKIEMKIFVTNLGKYNEGQLIGEWLDLPASKEERSKVFDKIGLNDMYEEYFITDYESNLNNIDVSEYSSITYLNDLIETMQDAEDDAGIWDAVLDFNGSNHNPSIEEIEELGDQIRNGEYVFYEGLSAEEYEEQLVDELCGHELERLGWLNHFITIDYEQIARFDDRIYDTGEGVLVQC